MALFEMVLNSIQNYITNLATAQDKTPLWFMLFILFLVIYFITIWFTDVSKSTAIFIAFLPILLLDYAFTLGTYTFRFPIVVPGIGEAYTIQNFTITFRLLDYVFNFGIWKDIGLATFNSVSGVYILSGIEKLFVFLMAFTDSILLFLLVAYIVYSMSEDLSYSFLGGAFVSLVYSSVSNPLREYNVAEATISHILYFLHVASPEQLIIVVLSAFMSFVIIVLLISTVTHFFVAVGKSTIRPGLEASSWEYNLTGVSFGLAVVYSVTAIMHSKYSWYVILPLLIVYSIIKSSMQSYATGRRERREQVEIAREAFDSVIDARR